MRTQCLPLPLRSPVHLNNRIWELISSGPINLHGNNMHWRQLFWSFKSGTTQIQGVTISKLGWGRRMAWVWLRKLSEISAATHLLKLCDLSPGREGQSSCHLFVLFQIFNCFCLHTTHPALSTGNTLLPLKDREAKCVFKQYGVRLQFQDLG